MKQLSATLFFCLVLSFNVFSQHCSSVSTPIPTHNGVAGYGFTPSYAAQPCAVIGSPVSDTIYLHVWDSIPGAADRVASLTIGAIDLPAGLCWQTDSANNRYRGGGYGVILITGTPTGPPGQYKLCIIDTLVLIHDTTAFRNVDTLSKQFGRIYDLRVICPGAACPGIDTASTNYYIPYTGGVCAGTVTASITPFGSVSFCPGGSLTLTADSASGYTYLWSTGATTRSISVNSAASYTVTVYSGADSAVATPTIVSVAALPDTALFLSGPVDFCTGDSVLMAGAAGLTYHWSTSATTRAIEVSAAGTYSLTVTNSAGCMAVSRAVAVTTGAQPNTALTITGPVVFCQGGSVQLSASPGFSYQWSNTDTAQSITVTASGSYSVTVSSVPSCSAVSGVVAVTTEPGPDTSLTLSGPTAFCQGDSVQISAASGLTYYWSNGAGTQSIEVYATAAYSVTVTNAVPCTAASGAVNVTVGAPPAASATLTGGNSLSASSAATYQWYEADTLLPGDSLQTLTAPYIGYYYVVEASAGGCAAVSDSVDVLSVNTGISTPPAAVALRLFPNPGDGLLTLEVPAGISGSYEVHDIQGRLIARSEVLSVQTYIDVTARPAGVYYLTVRTPQWDETIRFTVLK